MFLHFHLETIGPARNIRGCLRLNVVTMIAVMLHDDTYLYKQRMSLLTNVKQLGEVLASLSFGLENQA
jgi:hypothetical protein